MKRQMARIDGEVVEAPLKTKNAYRTLPLAEDTIAVLKQQKKKVGSSPWVFPSPTGGPISPDSVLHMLHRVLKRAGLPQGSVPRSAAHVRYAGPPERRGHQDGVRDAGTLLGRVHPGHLRPRHDSGPEGGGQGPWRRVLTAAVCKVAKISPKQQEEPRRRKSCASGPIF